MTDILLNIDDEYQLQFFDGDFVIDNSDSQNIRLNLVSAKGEWKQNPLIGANISKYLHMSQARSQYKKNITDALKIDNYKVKNISIEFDGFTSRADFNIEVE